MAKFSLLKSVVGSQLNDITSAFGSDEKEEESTPKDKKAEEKRALALKQAQDERKKKHEKEQYQREKMRQNLRDKYGIKKTTSGPSSSAVEEVKKSYNMDQDEAKQFDQAIAQDEARRLHNTEKIDKKLQKRQAKKELKK